MALRYTVVLSVGTVPQPKAQQWRMSVHELHGFLNANGSAAADGRPCARDTAQLQQDRRRHYLQSHCSFVTSSMSLRLLTADRTLLSRTLVYCRATQQEFGRASSSNSFVWQQSQLLEKWSGYGVGIEQAETLPASWYTQPIALLLEKQHVFYNTWQMVCSASQLQSPGDYLCGTLADLRYVIIRGQDGQLRAFHNVCRHHAAAVAEGCGNTSNFTCPYHSWTYDDRGRLVKATRLKGIKDFKVRDFGLHPLAIDTWGDLVFIHARGGRPPQPETSAKYAHSKTPNVSEWLGSGGSRLQDLGMSDSNLVHITRREYVINCNWKVFCDNYLDGGYHVPYAHKDLASSLDLSGYKNELHDTLSIQISPVNTSADDNAVPSDTSDKQQQQQLDQQGGIGSSSSSSSGVRLDRLAGGRTRDAGYAFVYPNLMINRYGPWMDTNVVLPLSGSSVDRCRVVFDYWLEADALQHVAARTTTTTKSHTARINSTNTSSSSSSSSSPSSSSNGDELRGMIDLAMQSEFVSSSLASSHQVQEEDTALCEAVQLGLQEPAYGSGRYAPGPEAPMYHFHTMYYEIMLKALEGES